MRADEPSSTHDARTPIRRRWDSLHWGWRWGMGAIAVALLWAAIAVGGGDRSDEGRAAAFTACTRYVKAVVVDPGAADFPPPSSATITHDGDRYTVRAYVDSEDAAGASTRTTFTCEVGGDSLRLVDLELG